MTVTTAPRFVVVALGAYFVVRDTVTGLDNATGSSRADMQDTADKLSDGRLVLDSLGRPRIPDNAPRADRMQVLRASIARRALAFIGVPDDAAILDVVRTGALITVITRHPERYWEFGVDVLRLATPDETDPELASWARLESGAWVLVAQAGADTLDEARRAAAEETAEALAREARTAAVQER